MVVWEKGFNSKNIFLFITEIFLSTSESHVLLLHVKRMTFEEEAIRRE